jgi:hypothetical protein
MAETIDNGVAAGVASCLLTAILQEPFSISIDEPFVDELTELITRLAIGGLLHASETRGGA